MPPPLKSVRALAPVERAVLRGLRGGAHGLDGGLDIALRALAAESVAEGLTLHPPDAPFVSIQERRILGLLALSQRRLRRPWVQSALAEALIRAAAALTDDQRRLPVARGIVGEGDFAELGLVSGRHRPSHLLLRRQGREPAGTLRAKMVAALHDHGSLYRHEIVRLGISRQYFHRMVHDGTLVAAGAGRYALSPRPSTNGARP